MSVTSTTPGWKFAHPPFHDEIANGPNSLPPTGLELVQAHWFVRHGERTPVRPRPLLAHRAGLPHQYNLCHLGRQFSAAVLDFDDNNEGIQGYQPIHRLVERQDESGGNIPRTGGSGECYWGELTDVGRASTRRFGEALRSLYVDKLGFIPKVITTETDNLVAFRSTPMPRTIESLQHIVSGLVSHKNQVKEGSNWIPKLAVRDPMEESLYPNTICAKLRKMEAFYANAAAIKWAPVLAQFDDKLTKFTDTPLRIDSSPRASGIIDTMAVCRAHNIPVPPEFENEEILETLERGILDEWFGGYDGSLEFRKLSMGRLLGDLQSTLERRINKKDDLRLAVYSFHDTSICGLLKVLGCFNNKWAPFTSHVGFELFSKPLTNGPSFLSRLFRPSQPTEEYFIRVKYNSKPLKIPACQPVGKHLDGSNGEVCTFEAFQEAIKDVVMTAEEWEKACSGGIGGHRG